MIYQSRILHIFQVFVLLCTLFFSASTSMALPSDRARAETWMTNGTVFSIVPDDYGKIFIGGDFTYIGPYTGNGVVFNSSTAKLAPPYPEVSDGGIEAVISDGAGGWYIGGSFTKVGGANAHGLAHILSDGAVDPNWLPDLKYSNRWMEGLVLDGYVKTLALNGQILYVGGRFTSVDGQPRGSLAAFDTATGELKPWNPNVTDIGVVDSIALYGNVLYMAGILYEVGGAIRDNDLAAVDATPDEPNPAATSWNPTTDAGVTCLAISGSTLYVGGAFNNIAGKKRYRLAAFDLISGELTSWTPVINKDILWASVWDLSVAGNRIFIAGAFQTIGNQTQEYTAAIYTSDGGLDSTWNPKLDSYVTSILATDTKVYLGGDFLNVNGEVRQHFAVVDVTNGDTVLGWGEAMGAASAFAESGQRLYVGTGYSIGGATRNRLASIDGKTGAATDWNPNANGVVYAMALDGGSLYVGGDFTNIGGVDRQKIAAIDSTSGKVDVLPNVAVDSVAYVGALSIGGDTLYMAGVFCNAEWVCAPLAAIDIPSGNFTDWRPNVDGSVSALLALDDVVYIGGMFFSVGDVPRNGLAAIDRTTGQATTWDPNPDYQPHTIATDGSKLYVGGLFTNMGGTERINLAAFDMANGNLIEDWKPNLTTLADYQSSYWVSSMTLDGSTLYAAGQYISTVAGTPDFISTINASTGAIESTLLTSANAGIRALAAKGGAVFAGGGTLFPADGQFPWRMNFGQFGEYSAPEPNAFEFITPPGPIIWPVVEDTPVVEEKGKAKDEEEKDVVVDEKLVKAKGVIEEKPAKFEDGEIRKSRPDRGARSSRGDDAIQRNFRITAIKFVSDPTSASALPEPDDETQITTTTSIVLLFDQPIDASTLTTNTVFVITQEGQKIDGTISYNTATSAMTFTPNAPLDPATNYTFVLTTDIRTVAGGTLETPYSKTFTTAPVTDPVVFPPVSGPDGPQLEPGGEATEVARGSFAGGGGCSLIPNVR